MSKRHHPAAAQDALLREPAARAPRRPAQAAARSTDAGRLSASPRLVAERGRMAASFGLPLQARADSAPARSAVLQRGQGGSKTAGTGADGEPLAHKRLRRTNKKGGLAYAHGKYELKQYRREVPIASLALSEDGDKSDEKLRDRLLRDGYNKFHAVLVFEQRDGSLKLVDGHHRVTEMRRLGETTIPAYVIPPDVHEAQEAIRPWHALDL